jgi:hypothetical protein
MLIECEKKPSLYLYQMYFKPLISLYLQVFEKRH